MATQSRVQLGCFPTPLQLLPNLIVKRDDLTGLVMGGSKVRMLEFIVGKALEQDAQVLVTAGSLHSNHCRLTAAAAARCGLECHLLIIGDPDEHRLEGNQLLSALLGARLFYINRTSAKQQIDDHLAKLCRDNVRFYLIPGGGHDPIGLWGYLAASLELITQLEELGVNPTRLFVTCGTGTTQAGLLLGLRLLGRSLPVTGVTVARSVQRCRDEIHSVIAQFCCRNKVDNCVSEADVEIDDRWIGSGYEVVSSERWQVIINGARRNALLLDPLYTGRTMQSVMDYLAREDDVNVVFVHTGGLPELFVNALQKEMTTILDGT